MDISFVIPAYNEEESIGILHGKISETMKSVTERYEILFVDDGSTDATYKRMKEISEHDDRVRVLKFRRNFGKSVALDEAFRRVSGEIVFTMDADLQDDPNEIPRFIEKIEQGYDLVSGWKQKRKDPVFSKNLPSKLFNFMIGVVSGLRLHDYNCGFKAYRRTVVNRISLYGELHRYVPAIAHSSGFQVTEIPVRHHSRPYGTSKFGISRFYRGFYDFITVVFLTRYLKRPMHLFGGIGLLFSTTGFLTCFYLTILWFGGESIGSRPLLILGVMLMLIGIQFISTGLVAEMITYGRQQKSREDLVEKYLNGKNE
ncbi:glycosyltransferase family 2 protein [Desulfobacterales bacterium HSG16]|nr:glycosyltransferase family 2 protein [Desulfobacterales bacterium HSG16]